MFVTWILIQSYPVAKERFHANKGQFNRIEKNENLITDCTDAFTNKSKKVMVVGGKTLSLVLLNEKSLS